MSVSFFFFNDTATTEIYTLSLTTLFRSAKREGGQRGDPVRAVPGRHVAARSGDCPGAVQDRDRSPEKAAGHRRSEEHTSELQSPCNLVCRLLLEKKKETYDSAAYKRSCR